MKFLLIFFLAFVGLIYLGNYLNYRSGEITRQEFERRIRFTLILIALVTFLYFYFR